MRLQTFILLALAIVCGGSAAVGVNHLRQPADVAEIQTVPVVTMSASLSRGALVTESALRVEQWPKALAPDGVIHQSEDAIGRAAMSPLVVGEPVLEGKLAARDSGRGLAAMIPRGMRAFTIHTPHIAAGVGGFILPGNCVDVLLTTTGSGPNDQTGGGATTTLLQNVEVLAVAQRLDAPEANKVDPKEASSVTLLVTPDHAAKLDLGMNRGILHLALRNPEDKDEAETQPATMSQLRLHQEPPQDWPAATFAKAGTILQALTSTPQEQQVAQTEPKRRHTTIHTLRGTTRGTSVLEW